MYTLFTSIKSKVIFVVVMIVGFGFLAYGAYDYQDTKSKTLFELTQLADIKAQRLAENIALPLWELDSKWIEKNIQAEMVDKRVHATFVYADNELFLGKEHATQKKIINSSNDSADKHILSAQDILFDGAKIGSVRVHITTTYMEQDLQEKLWRDTVSLAALALLITIVLVGFLNQIITRRLEEILATTQSIASGDYSKTITIPFKDEVGLLAQGINAMCHKIQLREAELLASEDRFRSLVNNAADAFFLIHTEDAHFLDVNKLACHNLGYSRDELLKMSIPDIQTKYDLNTLTSMYKTMAVGDIKTLAGEHQRKDGSLFPVEVRLSMIEQNGIHLIIALARDITLRMESEAKNRLFSQALEQSGEAVVITDNQGIIEHVNPTFTTVTGYADADAIGNNISILKSHHQDVTFYKNLWDTILSGQTWSSKITNKKKDGSLYPAMLTISPIRDEGGGISRFVATQQNLQTYEELEAKFHQAQKMEAIGTLVGGIAHDFNNTLAGIIGNLYLAKKEAKAIPNVVQRIQNVEKLSFGAAATIQQLLAFSRKGIVTMLPISIASFLKETIKLQQIAVPESISLHSDIHDTEMQINGDINQLQQVLINLINNASDALSGQKDPVITISLNRYEADDKFIKQHETLKGLSFACITITDNGTGIEPQLVEHIFEPFFTTKEQGKGTGLGLAMSYGSIKSHGGCITVTTKKGGADSGTSMHIFLPLLAETHDIPASVAKLDTAEGQGETILLVDDNETVLDTGRDVLSGLGYKVITAYNGENAVSLYQTYQADIDLVILDIVMPKLSGPDALQAIKKINPNVKAMFATGYDKSSSSRSPKYEITEPVIGKPFEIEKLSQIIRHLLDKP